MTELINLRDYRRHAALTKKHKSIRKIEDEYEYCLIDNYDLYLEYNDAQSVQLEKVFANFVRVGGRLIFVSILFPIDKFQLDEVISWLDNYDIHWQEKDYDDGILTNASEIIQGLKFMGNTIILYQKGHSLLNYDSSQYKEITEFYVQLKKVTDTNTIKEIDPNNDESGLKIFIDGEEFNEVPRIDFEQENLIISNGNFVSADYMDDFFGCVAFFRESDPDLPVVWIHDKNTTVYIELLENDDFGLICIVKFNYAIDLAAL